METQTDTRIVVPYLLEILCVRNTSERSVIYRTNWLVR